MSSNQQLLLSDAPDGPARGSTTYSSTSTQSYTWYPPAGVTKVSVVAVGGGTSNGGGLAYKNNITVVACNGYAVRVSSDACGSYFINSSTVRARGGASIGSSTGDGGGSGGQGQGNSFNGGGGAGGYSGTGGNGGGGVGASGTSGSGGGGGGGGAAGLGSCGWVKQGVYWYYYEFYGGGGGGGGVGINGTGSNGSGGSGGSGGTGGAGGGGGSSGNNGGNGGSGNNSSPGAGANGGAYGGGRGEGGRAFTYRAPLPCFCCPCLIEFPYTGSNGTGGAAAVRIVWPGCSRSFPSTDVGSP